MNVPTLPIGQFVSVFDFVGILQEDARGHHFYALALGSTEERQGELWAFVEPARYDAGYPPANRIENILCDIRQDHPGISFQCIHLLWDGYRVYANPAVWWTWPQ